MEKKGWSRNKRMEEVRIHRSGFSILHALLHSSFFLLTSGTSGDRLDDPEPDLPVAAVGQELEAAGDLRVLGRVVLEEDAAPRAAALLAEVQVLRGAVGIAVVPVVDPL